MSHEALLWIDVETTGLDETEGYLLEIAAVPTAFDADFTQIGEPFTVLVSPLGGVSLDGLDQHVKEMHTTTGLWDEASRYGVLEHEALSFFRQALTNWGMADGRTVYLAGRSVHFDRSWLEHRNAFKDVALSHRLFDLTPIKAFANLCGIPLDVPEDAHRALADVEADIALARSMVGSFQRAA